MRNATLQIEWRNNFAIQTIFDHRVKIVKIFNKIMIRYCTIKWSILKQSKNQNYKIFTNRRTKNYYRRRSTNRSFSRNYSVKIVFFFFQKRFSFLNQIYRIITQHRKTIPIHSYNVPYSTRKLKNSNGFCTTEIFQK